MRRCCTLLICVSGMVWLPHAAAPGEAPNATDQSQREVHPATIRLAARYRLQFIKTPGGFF